MNMIMMFDLFMFFILIIPSHLIKFHPLSLNLLLILYTIIMILKLNYWNNMFWYSYMMFLIIVGGIMILFLYLTSISNNEMMLYNLKYYLYMYMKSCFMIMIYMFYYWSFNYYGLEMFTNSVEINNLFNFNKEFLLDFKNLYMNLNMDINIYLIIYLLLVMIMCVLICMKNSLPLRQMLN
uniref:NADH dehydrogenase subunit 6 n=1 Tax=Homolobus sp. QL-2013 TaxID=1421595 RepID=A0A0A6ZKY5_9HYME|nr:NADH dehydrogenase subunit 6 [Homolobus sp. QL-2013]